MSSFKCQVIIQDPTFFRCKVWAPLATGSLYQCCTCLLPPLPPPSSFMTHEACSRPLLTALLPPMFSTPPAAGSQGSTGTPPSLPPSASPSPTAPLPCTPWAWQVEMWGEPTATHCHLQQGWWPSPGVQRGNRWWLLRRMGVLLRYLDTVINMQY